MLHLKQKKWDFFKVLLYIFIYRYSWNVKPRIITFQERWQIIWNSEYFEYKIKTKYFEYQNVQQPSHTWLSLISHYYDLHIEISSKNRYFSKRGPNTKFLINVMFLIYIFIILSLVKSKKKKIHLYFWFVRLQFIILYQTVCQEYYSRNINIFYRYKTILGIYLLCAHSVPRRITILKWCE